MSIPVETLLLPSCGDCVSPPCRIAVHVCDVWQIFWDCECDFPQFRVRKIGADENETIISTECKGSYPLETYTLYIFEGCLQETDGECEQWTELGRHYFTNRNMTVGGCWQRNRACYITGDCSGSNYDRFDDLIQINGHACSPGVDFDNTSCKIESLLVDGTNVAPQDPGHPNAGCLPTGLGRVCQDYWVLPEMCYVLRSLPLASTEVAVRATSSCGETCETVLSLPCWLTSEYLLISVPSFIGGSGEHLYDPEELPTCWSSAMGWCGSLWSVVTHVEYQESLSIGIGGTYAVRTNSAESSFHQIKIGTGTFSARYFERRRARCYHNNQTWNMVEFDAETERTGSVAVNVWMNVSRSCNSVSASIVVTSQMDHLGNPAVDHMPVRGGWPVTVREENPHIFQCESANEFNWSGIGCFRAFGGSATCDGTALPTNIPLIGGAANARMCCVGDTSSLVWKKISPSLLWFGPGGFYPGGTSTAPPFVFDETTAPAVVV